LIRLITSGESHGEYMVGILEGIPAGLEIDKDLIKNRLALRRLSYGRSERMEIEEDDFEIFGGVDEKLVTTGAPIGFRVLNLDYKKNRTKRFSKIPRPGHVDYSGSIKFDFENFYLPSERRSGRLTVLDTIGGAICEKLLNELNIKLYFSVMSIGKVLIPIEEILENIENNFNKILNSKLLVPYLEYEKKMIDEIDKAKENGDTLGGSGVVVVKNFPPGIGDYNNYLDNLDGILAQAIFSIPSVKCVEIGEGIKSAFLYGSEFHDEFYIENSSVKRKSNNCGGIEGGVSNGSDLIIKFYAKPIPTNLKGLSSIDFESFIETKSKYVRSDVTVVPAITVIAMARVSIVLSNEIKKKFGGDTLDDLKRNLLGYIESRRRFWQKF